MFPATIPSKNHNFDQATAWKLPAGWDPVNLMMKPASVDPQKTMTAMDVD